MREILFRGKTDKGEWTEGFYGQFHNRPTVDEPNIHQIFTLFTEEEEKENEGHIFSAIGGLWHTVIPSTIGQYTGLTDKNGTKIFEGDILVFCKGATYPYKIEWDGMGWKLYRSDGKRIKEAFECNEIHYVNISEVIGNIHDNPELLESEVDTE